MPIASTDIKHYRAQYHPSDDTSQVGGARTSFLITGTSSGEVIPDGSLVLSESSDVVVYYKTFVANTHPSLTFSSPKVYLLNALPDSLPGTGSVRLVATGADSGKVVRLTGVSGGIIRTEELTLVSGAVDSTLSYSVLVRAELLSGVAANDIQIRYAPTDEEVGIIPKSSKTATAEVDIGVDASADSGSSSLNRLTAPSGITFSRPRTPADGISIGALGPNVGWGIWRKYRFRAGSLPPVSPGLFVELRVQGLSS